MPDRTVKPERMQVSGIDKLFREEVESAKAALSAHFVDVRGEVLDVSSYEGGTVVTIAERGPPVRWIEAWLDRQSKEATDRERPRLQPGLGLRLQGWLRVKDDKGCRLKLELREARIVNIKRPQRTKRRREQDAELDAIEGKAPELDGPVRKVAVVWGTGAAYGDFRGKLLQDDRRKEFAIWEVPARVDDPADVAKKIGEAAKTDCDAIAVVRGGGDAADLLPFNEPVLGKALASATKPVILGIGHRKDRPLCGRFATIAAATPTDAAVQIARHNGILAARAKTKEREEALQAVCNEREGLRRERDGLQGTLWKMRLERDELARRIDERERALKAEKDARAAELRVAKRWKYGCVALALVLVLLLGVYSIEQFVVPAVASWFRSDEAPAAAISPAPPMKPAAKPKKPAHQPPRGAHQGKVAPPLPSPPDEPDAVPPSE